MNNNEIQQRQRSSILKNASFLFIAHVAGRILSFVLTIMLPRYLKGGFDDLGKYFFALWLTNLLSSVTELGLQTPIIRDISADKSKASLLISNAFVIRIILSIVNFIILATLVMLKYPGEVGVLIYIIGLSEIINAIAQLFRCTFRAYEDMGYEALGVIVERFVVFLIGIGSVMLGYGIVAFGVVVLIASIVNLALTFLIMVFKFCQIRFRLVNVKICFDLLKKSLPYALGGLLYMAYFRVDGILLKNIMGTSGDVAMGWYGTGYSFVNALTVIPGAFMGAVFPVMSRAFSSSVPSELDSLYTRSLKLMFMIGLPIAIGVGFLAVDIVMMLYPPSRFGLADREALSIILKVLIWSGMLLFLNTVIITLYRATDARKAFAIVTALSLCTNIISNLILIPKYSYLGASISMIISESLFFICGSLYIQKYISKINDFGSLLKILLASVALILVLIIFKHFMLINQYFHVTLTIIVGFFVYTAIIFGIRAITSNDFAMVRDGRK
jgi:O-antigen/teichoic acid export membrane protein